MVSANTPATGRTRIFLEVSVYDHERGVWVAWQSLEHVAMVNADALLQRVIDDGHDDIRVLAHLSGSSDECSGINGGVGSRHASGRPRS